ncbi:MAG: hypothetical protein KDC95_09655 [Planctomycetes bacterium]|nr:hypothetical protein [Planctomycetota bacterium]
MQPSHALAVLTLLAPFALGPSVHAQDRLMELAAAPVPGKTLALQLQSPVTSAGRPYLIYWSAHTDFVLDLPIAFLRGSLRIDLAGFANPALLVGILSPTGRSTTGLPIPNDPTFLGQTIDLQSLEVDFINFLLYLGDNDVVATFVGGIGSTALAEGRNPSTITGDFAAQLVVDSSLGQPLAQQVVTGAFQPIRHAGVTGIVEGYPYDFVETPGTTAIDVHRTETVSRRLVNGIYQSISLPNGFDLAIVRLAQDCRDFTLVSIERATGIVRELSGARIRDATLTCPSTTRFSIYRPDFAFTSDGEIALAVVRDSGSTATTGPPDRLLLIHTDPSKTWTSGNNVVDISPSGTQRFVDGGLILSRNRLVALAETTTAALVYEGPADGVSVPSPLAVPTTGTNKVALTSNGHWRLSTDGTTACITLANGNDHDVYAIRGIGSTASVVLVSGFTTTTRLAAFRRDTSGADGSRAAISPLGTRVAFVSGGGNRSSLGAHELWVANTDGTQRGIATAVIAPSFDSQVDWVGGVHFVAENRLLFLAGEDEGACDVYAYDPTTGSTANITRTSTGNVTTPPFTQGGSTGNVASRGSFTSGNGRYVYWVRGFGGRVPSPPPSTNNLIAIDTQSLSVKDITGNDFGTGGTTFGLRGGPLTTYAGLSMTPRPALELAVRRAPGASPLAFFVAESATSFDASELHDCNVFAFDIENAGVARALTGHTGKGSLDDIVLVSHLVVSPDGAHVAYAARKGEARASEDVFVVKADGSSGPRQLSKSSTAQTITDGSITFTGSPIDGVVWSRGYGSSSLPFERTLAEWSLVTGQPLPFVLSAPSSLQRVVLVLASGPHNP